MRFVPHLTTAHTGPFNLIESAILSQVEPIEKWFREHWQETPAPITSSVDLRHAGFKLAPVDTNLFPAGFNNLNSDFLPLCVEAVQSVMSERFPGCARVLLLPENHTRNAFYLQSLLVLRDVFEKAGFVVRIGSLDSSVISSIELTGDDEQHLLIEPLQRHEARVRLSDFDSCLLLLNNDLSSGLPEFLKDIKQMIQPPVHMGWFSRLKSQHFHCYAGVVQEFSELIDIDPWLMSPLFSAVDGVNFMTQTGLSEVARSVDDLLSRVREKYTQFGISDDPYVVVKADNGTYGMGVMMVHEGAQLLALNRKQRTRMSATKGSQELNRLILQEGVYSVETMPNGAVAEPVVYMIGQYVVGGFYRVHQGRGVDENLNAPGMHFEPLGFAQPCHIPCDPLAESASPNRFYVYGVIARLAALAAAREIKGDY
jgi:glutamate--cysteine ligase